MSRIAYEILTPLLIPIICGFLLPFFYRDEILSRRDDDWSYVVGSSFLLAAVGFAVYYLLFFITAQISILIGFLVPSLKPILYSMSALGILMGFLAFVIVAWNWSILITSNDHRYLAFTLTILGALATFPSLFCAFNVTLLNPGQTEFSIQLSFQHYLATANFGLFLLVPGVVILLLEVLLEAFRRHRV